MEENHTFNNKTKKRYVTPKQLAASLSELKSFTDPKLRQAERCKELQCSGLLNSTGSSIAPALF